MEGYIGVFAKLSSAAKRAPSGAETYIDRLNYVLTPAILLGIATIIGMKQYVFQPIQCWSFKEMDKQRMEYAENYCWVENTFFYGWRNPMEHDAPGRGKTIYYYQWVPFVLMSQAALFYAPHLLWLMLSGNCGVDMRQLAEQARKVDNEPDEASRQKRVRFLCNSLLRFVRFRDRFRQKSAFRKLCASLAGKPSFAMFLVFAYLLVKLCYALNCVGQLYLMRKFLGLNMTGFGFRLLSDLSSNRTWETSNVFPRVTFCQFLARMVGGPVKYTIQCVLPVNMLNEKFYILIWFWVVLILTLNVMSLLRWSLKLLFGPNRHRVIRKYLRVAERVRIRDFRRQSRDIEMKFAREFLDCDGAFALTVINRAAGELVACEVAVGVFEGWLEPSRLPPSEKPRLVDDEKMPLQEETPLYAM